MKQPQTYSTPAAFRQALEKRLQQQAEAEDEDIMRLRRQVAFDRLLARIFTDEKCPWALKGGYALELRLKEARTTKDLDLTLQNSSGLPEGDVLASRLQSRLQGLADRDVGDPFSFLVGKVMLDIDAAPYGGARFPVETRLANRVFIEFHVDIGVGDAVIKPSDSIEGTDWLGFAGMAPPKIICISKEQQFAEKLHAYSMPNRTRPNSRVKDLVDMALMLQRFPLDPVRVREAVGATFARRGSHVVPDNLLPPPPEWTGPFARLAAQTELGLDIHEAFKELEGYFQEVFIRGR